ncbi:response regulator transcription factor [Anaerocolumna sp. AGMB13020]|uniref:response regulator transcription factor n=1 Tax=Anaerocolumna sp. AGMB13020 TaxID=3081750 RepID=UPI002954B6F7|nr:response regulator transcription factor [Anaerocolumna sp. AGMB13020]WOO37533.1 response regulator transcription factor [Anaerocolumna sp. AGMB13020]
MKYDCLIVDDEIPLSESTSEYFNMFDIKTTWVADAAACLAFFKENKTDLILLDINLGTDSGFSLCKKIRENLDVPILFISARNSDDDILLALGIGGDDYISKPYSLNVLLAKVKAVLKRYQNKESEEISFGRYTINFHLERVFCDGNDLGLKAMEYKLLSYLVRNSSRIISKEELFDKVWGDSITGDGTLNVHIRRLREKIEDDPNNPKYIRTIWGTGYIFEA